MKYEPLSLKYNPRTDNQLIKIQIKSSTHTTRPSCNPAVSLCAGGSFCRVAGAWERVSRFAPQTRDHRWSRQLGADRVRG